MNKKGTRQRKRKKVEQKALHTTNIKGLYFDRTYFNPLLTSKQKSIPDNSYAILDNETWNTSKEFNKFLFSQTGLNAVRYIGNRYLKIIPTDNSQTKTEVSWGTVPVLCKLREISNNEKDTKESYLDEYAKLLASNKYTVQKIEEVETFLKDTRDVSKKTSYLTKSDILGLIDSNFYKLSNLLWSNLDAKNKLQQYNMLVVDPLKKNKPVYNHFHTDYPRGISYVKSISNNNIKIIYGCMIDCDDHTPNKNLNKIKEAERELGISLIKELLPDNVLIEKSTKNFGFHIYIKFSKGATEQDAKRLDKLLKVIFKDAGLTHLLIEVKYNVTRAPNSKEYTVTSIDNNTTNILAFRNIVHNELNDLKLDANVELDNDEEEKEQDIKINPYRNKQSDSQTRNLEKLHQLTFLDGYRNETKMIAVRYAKWGGLSLREFAEYMFLNKGTSKDLAKWNTNQIEKDATKAWNDCHDDLYSDLTVKTTEFKSNSHLVPDDIKALVNSKHIINELIPTNLKTKRAKENYRREAPLLFLEIIGKAMFSEANPKQINKNLNLSKQTEQDFLTGVSISRNTASLYKQMRLQQDSTLSSKKKNININRLYNSIINSNLISLFIHEADKGYNSVDYYRDECEGDYEVLTKEVHYENTYKYKGLVHCRQLIPIAYNEKESILNNYIATIKNFISKRMELYKLYKKVMSSKWCKKKTTKHNNYVLLKDFPKIDTLAIYSRGDP